MWTDKIHAVLLSPITGLLVAFILAALAASGRLSMSLSNILLIAAFFVGCFGICHAGYGIHFKIIFCLLLGIILTLISWWIKPSESTSPPEKQVSSKIIVSVHEIMPNPEGFLTIKIAFSNDSSKPCIIENVYIMTAYEDNLMEINKSDASIENNYNNMLNTDIKISLIPSLTPKTNLPKELKPSDLWLYTIKEPFDPKKYFKRHKLTNIKRMPLGISIKMVDFEGKIRHGEIYPCAEITFSEDGKITGARTVHKPTELILK